MKIEIEMTPTTDGHYQFKFDTAQIGALGIALLCCEDLRPVALNAAAALYALDEDREKFMIEFYKHAKEADARIIRKAGEIEQQRKEFRSGVIKKDNIKS